MPFLVHLPYGNQRSDGEGVEQICQTSNDSQVNILEKYFTTA